jgi:WD40 repeat protein
VTGADDALVKIFYIGAAKSNASAQPTFNYGSNDRSAILVCTLRGHAGVICDIDVSSDNAFLATASDDGDCRVWALKDGTPIAILRGHKDGANMVSSLELYKRDQNAFQILTFF